MKSIGSVWLVIIMVTLGLRLSFRRFFNGEWCSSPTKTSLAFTCLCFHFTRAKGKKKQCQSKKRRRFH